LGEDREIEFGRERGMEVTGVQPKKSGRLAEGVVGFAHTNVWKGKGSKKNAATLLVLCLEGSLAARG